MSRRSTEGPAVRFVSYLVTAIAITAAMEIGTGADRRIERVVYVGTYTGEASKGIYAFTFDDRSGGVPPLGLVAETPSPSFLTASADGKFLFAVNELSTFRGAPGGSVSSFAIDPPTGKLTEP